jgi:hypothetical protein
MTAFRSYVACSPFSPSTAAINRRRPGALICINLGVWAVIALTFCATVDVFAPPKILKAIGYLFRMTFSEKIGI